MGFFEWTMAPDRTWSARQMAGDLGNAERVDVSESTLRTRIGYAPAEALGRITSVPDWRPRVTKLDPAAYEALRNAAVVEAHTKRPAPMGEVRS